MDMDFNMPTIITKRNTDSSGNPISVKLIEIRQIMDHYSCVVLSQTPDELNRICIEGFTEVFDIERLDKKNFKVDYNQGIIYFHPFNIGKAISIEYYGTGYELISASKVFTKVDKYGNVIDTLESILERADLQLKLVETLGGAIKVIEKLDVNIKNANNLNAYFDEMLPEATGLKNELDTIVTDAKGWKDQLKQDVTDGKVLQPLLHNDIIQGNATKQQLEQTIANAQDDINKIEATGNEIVYISSSEWVYNDTSKMYEKQITHTCNSENLLVSCKSTDTKDALFLPWKPVDGNNILLKSDEPINTSVVISARYYKPLIDNTTTQEVIDARKGEIDLKTKIDKVDEGMVNIKESISNIILQREYIDINLNDFALISKHGSVDEDWSLAFNHVFENVIKNNCGIIKWNGRLKVKSTINVPYGVSLCGTSLPYSGLTPSSDFIGEYVITQLSNESHIDFRNIYIDFTNNSNVRGIYIANPYDYSTLDTLVGNQCNKTFLVVGNEKVGQTLRVQNLCIYSKNTISEPLAVIENLQEGYFCNNKFLSSGLCNVDLVQCDGVNTSTWINNSFANSNKRGITYKFEKHPKRAVGNLFTGNLFENIKGDYSLAIIGNSISDYEGYNNSIMNNDYMESTQSILLEYVANSIVIDRAGVTNGTGSRRTFNINPYDDSVATNPYGHCMLKADGDLLDGKFRGEFSGNIKSKLIKIATLLESQKQDAVIQWNASDNVDYGLQFLKDGTMCMNILNDNIVNPSVGGGYCLKSPNGTEYKIKVDDSGNITTERI